MITKGKQSFFQAATIRIQDNSSNSNNLSMPKQLESIQKLGIAELASDSKQFISISNHFDQKITQIIVKFSSIYQAIHTKLFDISLHHNIRYANLLD